MQPVIPITGVYEKDAMQSRKMHDLLSSHVETLTRTNYSRNFLPTIDCQTIKPRHGESPLAIATSRRPWFNDLINAHGCLDQTANMLAKDMSTDRIARRPRKTSKEAA